MENYQVNNYSEYGIRVFYSPDSDKHYSRPSPSSGVQELRRKLREAQIPPKGLDRRMITDWRELRDGTKVHIVTGEVLPKFKLNVK